MKLIIQIRYNKAQTLPQPTLNYKHLPGIDEIEYLVTDDGSDGTGETACQVGVQHVIRVAGSPGITPVLWRD
jgi:hypothetical protein